MTDEIDVTPEMIEAGKQALERGGWFDCSDASVADAYRAMHAKAPKNVFEKAIEDAAVYGVSYTHVSMKDVTYGADIAPEDQLD